jgi:hypothetical protein
MDIDVIRKQLAAEHELADQLAFCLQMLMRDYITRELDPRTDEAITTTLAAYRDARNFTLTD